MSATDENSPYPLRLEKTEDRCLLIEWSDGVEQRTRFRKLRDNCHCATCLDKRMEAAKEDRAGQPKLSTVLPVLSMAETLPVDILQMHPAGNYAYNIRFSDGHSSGIFTFELLRSLID